MDVRSGLCALSLIIAGSGCLLQNIAPTERLRDAVIGLNDEARWSRMDLATERVAPRYREHWARTHREWGRRIQIGDVELLEVRVGDDSDSAVSVVAVSWYSFDTMTLHRTVLRQKWQSSGRDYVLASEEVVEGARDLIAGASASASESS